MGPSVVDVFVVTIELKVFAQGQKQTSEETRGAPFRILALVTELGRSVRPRMIGANRHAALNCDSIAIGPTKTAVGPIEIRAVSICNQNAAWERDMKHEDGLHAVNGRLHGGRKIAVPDGEHHGHAFYVIQIGNGDFLQTLEWPEVELQARPQLRVIQIAVFHVTLGIEDEPDVGTQAEVRVDFGQKGRDVLRPNGGTRPQQEDCDDQTLVRHPIYFWLPLSHTVDLFAAALPGPAAPRYQY